GREIDVAGAPTLIGRNVVIGAGGEVARGGVAIGGNDEQVGTLAFVPVGPVAIEKMLSDMGLHFVLFFFDVAFAVAVIVFAVGVHRGSEGDGLSIGRPFHDVGAGRQFRELLCFASLERKQVHLGIAAAGREKGDGFSVGRPNGRGIMAALR